MRLLVILAGVPILGVLCLAFTSFVAVGHLVSILSGIGLDVPNPEKHSIAYA